MKFNSFPFEWIILGFGIACGLGITGNLILLGMHRHPAPPHLYVNGGNFERGRQALSKFGCGGCHAIPGVQNATGRVGPRLEGLNQQSYIAGQLLNSPENLVNWIKDPQKYSPQSAMPTLNVTDQEARDMAEYLYRASDSFFMLP